MSHSTAPGASPEPRGSALVGALAGVLLVVGVRAARAADLLAAALALGGRADAALRYSAALAVGFGDDLVAHDDFSWRLRLRNPALSHQGQCATPDCTTHGPRGPIKSGPTLLRRRPSLSQHPPGSQVVIAEGRATSRGGGIGAAGASRGASITGGRVAIAGYGEPERSRAASSRPRHASITARRAFASAS